MENGHQMELPGNLYYKKSPYSNPMMLASIASGKIIALGYDNLFDVLQNTIL